MVGAVTLAAKATAVRINNFKLCTPPLIAHCERQQRRIRREIQSAPNNSRVARTLPLSMSLLAQSGIEQMREPDTCLLQLLTDDPLGKKMVNTIPRRDRRQTMTEWANYHSNGKRVPPSSKRAAFRAKEVSVDTGVLPGRPCKPGRR